MHRASLAAGRKESLQQTGVSGSRRDSANVSLIVKGNGARRESVILAESKCNGTREKNNCDNGYKKRKDGSNTIAVSNGTSSSILVADSIVEAGEEEERLAG